MRPWYASEPRQLDGARVASVIDPVAVSRAWALLTLLDGTDRSAKTSRRRPHGSATHVPWLGRLWGDGLIKAKPLALNQSVLDWSRSDPEGLLAAARHIARETADRARKTARTIDAN